MKVELKNVKYAAFASEETHCFSATVYLDGKASIQVSNEGHGGGDMMRDLVPGATARLDAYCKTLPPVPMSWDENRTLPMDAEILIGDLMNAWLEDKHSKNLKAALQRSFATKIVFTRSDKPGIWEVKLKGQKVTPEHIVKFKATRPYAAVVLNELPIDEAFKVQSAAMKQEAETIVKT
jgi:hypothetical protein